MNRKLFLKICTLFPFLGANIFVSKFKLKKNKSREELFADFMGPVVKQIADASSSCRIRDWDEFNEWDWAQTDSRIYYPDLKTI
jgi:hypothetical protein